MPPTYELFSQRRQEYYSFSVGIFTMDGVLIQVQHLTNIRYDSTHVFSAAPLNENDVGKPAMLLVLDATIYGNESFTPLSLRMFNRRDLSTAPLKFVTYPDITDYHNRHIMLQIPFFAGIELYMDVVA